MAGSAKPAIIVFVDLGFVGVISVDVFRLENQRVSAFTACGGIRLWLEFGARRNVTINMLGQDDPMTIRPIDRKSAHGLVKERDDVRRTLGSVGNAKVIHAVLVVRHHAEDMFPRLNASVHACGLVSKTSNDCGTGEIAERAEEVCHSKPLSAIFAMPRTMRGNAFRIAATDPMSSNPSRK